MDQSQDALRQSCNFLRICKAKSRSDPWSDSARDYDRRTSSQLDQHASFTGGISKLLTIFNMPKQYRSSFEEHRGLMYSVFGMFPKSSNSVSDAMLE